MIASYAWSTVTVLDPDTSTIGGNVSGLVGTGIILQNNGGDDLLINGLKQAHQLTIWCGLNTDESDRQG